MIAKRQAKQRKYFTAAEANATLPLVRAIVTDITELARELHERHERLAQMPAARLKGLTEGHREELLLDEAEFDRNVGRMRDLVMELRQLGVELKDYFTGLVDFPCLMDGREVYLCWRLGEPEVGHWHELEAGFTGRQKLFDEAARS
jgi:hypothetical protein